MVGKIDTMGMNSSNYDGERDVAEAEIPGQIGIDLADGIFRARLRRDEEREMVNQERGFPAIGRPRKGSKAYWENVARIVLCKFPATEPDEWGEASPRELRRRLGQLRRAGYEVPRYSKMHVNVLRRTYRGIQEKIGNEASRHCPEVLNEIREENRSGVLEDFNAR